jgi:cytochrome c oxidase cbb3-type subunit 3
VRHWAPVFLLVPVLWADEPQIRNPKTSPEDVAAGGRIFRSHCAECHGLHGEGGRGPDLTSGRFRHGESDAELLRTIMKGIPGSEMPGIYMEDHQVWQIVSYVRSLSARSEDRTVPGDHPGGERLFGDKGGCAACHMVNGAGGRLGPDLSDIGALRSLEHLRESLLEPNKRVGGAWWTFHLKTAAGERITGLRLNEDTYSIQILDQKGNLRSFLKAELSETRVSKESSMPAYGSTLTPGELDDLVAYLHSLRRK